MKKEMKLAVSEQLLSSLLTQVNAQLLNATQAMDRIDWRDQHSCISTDQRIRGIINEGFQKKFFDPNSGLTEELHKKALNQFLVYDDELSNHPSLFSQDGYHREVAESIRKRISKVLRNFDEYLTFDNAWPGPGETFFSSKGNVSPIGKFSSDWSVTENCLDNFILAIVSNRHLLRYALPEIDTWDNSMVNSPLSLAFIKERLKDKIQIVPGNRFFTVFKSNTESRVACAEPLGNSCIQRMVGRALRKCLLINCGVDLDTLAYSHHDMLRRGGYATIDLSKASDSVTIGMLREYFPGNVVSICESSRSPSVVYEIDNQPYAKHLNKVSSMGCGFTFELMTVLLYSALTCDAVGEYIPMASVFGDDIIVPTESYEFSQAIIEALGFIVNKDKSFSGQSISESCGLYVVDGVEVERFDFRYIEDLPSLIMTHNKLCVLIDKYPNFPESRYWKVVRETILAQLSVYAGPYLVDLPRNVYGQRVMPTWLMCREGTNRTHDCMTIEHNLQLRDRIYEVTAVEQQTTMFTATHHGELSMCAAMATMMTPHWWRRNFVEYVERKYFVRSDGTILWSKSEYMGRSGNRKGANKPLYDRVDLSSDQYLLTLSMILGDHVREKLPCHIGHQDEPRDDCEVKTRMYGAYISLRKLYSDYVAGVSQTWLDMTTAHSLGKLSAIRCGNRYENEGVYRMISRQSPRFEGITYESHRKVNHTSAVAGHVNAKKTSKPHLPKRERRKSKGESESVQAQILRLEKQLKKLKSSTTKPKRVRRR